MKEKHQVILGGIGPTAFRGWRDKVIFLILEHLSLDSFLKMGMTLLDFRIEGKTLSEKESLNSSDNWFEILLLSNFKIFVGILVGPTAFRGSRDKMIFLISILSTGFVKKELISIYIRKKIMKSISRKLDCGLK